MNIEQNKSLKPFNTFGIDVKAKAFISITSVKQLIEVLHKYKDRDFFILSGGSNILLTKDIDKIVIHIAIKGISTEKRNNDTIQVSAMAGENWHRFVQYCIKNNFGGLENLSLIPGYVGSSPIQNIGAYGVEIKDTLISCETINIKTGKVKIFTNEACKFGYRNSIFKNEFKSIYIITKVTFLLTTKNHRINTKYGTVEKILKEQNITSPTLKDISDAIINIRESKLPDPKKIGNSGSFFKNPIIPRTLLHKLQQENPDIPYYEIDELSVKLPAGWLIDQCGLKGKRWGDAGIHAKQALVLVNYNKATGAEILKVSEIVRNTVKNKFSIQLETEVNII